MFLMQNCIIILSLCMLLIYIIFKDLFFCQSIFKDLLELEFLSSDIIFLQPLEINLTCNGMIKLSDR